MIKSILEINYLIKNTYLYYLKLKLINKMRLSNQHFFNKLKYELKFRKKEFLKLCIAKDY